MDIHFLYNHLHIVVTCGLWWILIYHLSFEWLWKYIKKLRPQRDCKVLLHGALLFKNPVSLLIQWIFDTVFPLQWSTLFCWKRCKSSDAPGHAQVEYLITFDRYCLLLHVMPEITHFYTPQLVFSKQWNSLTLFHSWPVSNFCSCIVVFFLHSYLCFSYLKSDTVGCY